MAAIVYARVSTEEQAREGYSLASQLEACRVKARALGEMEMIECVDEGVSGEILARPQLTRAREIMRQGGIGAFVCLDPDRLARKLAHQLLITEEIERCGVRLEFVNFDRTKNPEGNLLYAVRGAIAEYEKEKIKERTIRGKLQKAKQGGLTHWTGTYGYSYTKKDGKRDGFVTVNEDEAAMIRQIYEWFIAENLGYHQIVNRLEQEGTPSPRGVEWARMTVKRVLTNPTYKGDLIVHKNDTSDVKNNKFKPEKERVRRKIRPDEEWIHLSVPAIVSATTWGAAQARAIEAKRTRPGRSVADYLLSGIARCQVCGATAHGNLITGKTKKIPYYVCTNRSPGVPGVPKCSLRFLRSDEIDAEIWRLIKNWLTNPRLLARHLASQQTADTSKRELATLERRLDSITKERTRLLNALQKGLLPEDELEKRLLEIKRRYDQTHARLEELRSRVQAVPTAETTITTVRQLAESLGPELDILPFTKRQQVVRLLVKQVVIGPEETVVMAKVPEFLVHETFDDAAKMLQPR